MTDLYAELEVSPQATAVELKRAYRKAAQRWHPDRNPDDPNAEAKFKKIAAAWEILGDPVKRAEHDGVASATARGVLPDEFVDAVENAIERSQSWIERAVIPHYTQWYRGAGSEMVTRLIADQDKLVDTSLVLDSAGFWERRRARLLIERIVVTVSPYPSRDISRLIFGRQWEISISPTALWSSGFREGADIDDAVLRTLFLRYCQVLGMGRLGPLPGVDDPELWAVAIAEARKVDSGVIQERVAWGIAYALFGALILSMLGSGYMSG